MPLWVLSRALYSGGPGGLVCRRVTCLGLAWALSTSYTGVAPLRSGCNNGRRQRRIIGTGVVKACERKYTSRDKCVAVMQKGCRILRVAISSEVVAVSVLVTATPG